MNWEPTSPDFGVYENLNRNKTLGEGGGSSGKLQALRRLPGAGGARQRCAGSSAAPRLFVAGFLGIDASMGKDGPLLLGQSCLFDMAFVTRG